MLDALGDPSTPGSLASSTVVFITNDNGPENGTYNTGRSRNHDANGPFAGRKRDNWEGGTRVPFMIRWPGKVSAGSTSLPRVEVAVPGPDEITFHRHLAAGLGHEVLVSTDLATWEPFSRYFAPASAAPPSDLGSDYEKVTLVSNSPLPDNLFVSITVHALQP